MKTACLALLLILAALPAGAQDRKFRAGDTFTAFGLKVYDGDSGLAEVPRGDALPTAGDDAGSFQDVPFRLFAVSAPEWDTPFGPFAAMNLHRLAFNRILKCSVIQTDDYKRKVVICRDDAGLDIGERMIRDGLATVYRKYLWRYNDRHDRTLTYLAAEADACRDRRGLWRGRPDGIC